MKYLFSILTMLICFESQQAISQTTNCDSVPEINKQVIVFVKSKQNTKVGRGECWDVAAEALKYADAKLPDTYVFGKLVNYQKECVYPGDIIQFERVKLKYTIGNANYVEEMSHHTAVIYEVKGKGMYILAHQNTSEYGKKVGLTPINLEDVTKGKFKIYRPTK